MSYALVVLFLAWPAAAQDQNQQLKQTPSGGSVPVPDPTALTTSQLNREIELLKTTIDLADNALRDQIAQRFTSLEQAIELRDQKVDDAIEQRNQIVERVRAESIERVNALQSLIEERFNRVDAGFDNVANQFANRDTALNAALTATQTAANNALTATKEAVATAGLVTEKQIAQQGKLQEEGMNGLRTSVIESQRRLDILEGRTAGLGDASKTQYDSAGLLISVVAVMGSLTSVVIALISLNKAKPERTQYPEQVRYVHVRPEQPQQPAGITTTTNTSAQ
jgi:hypothetical protein